MVLTEDEHVIILTPDPYDTVETTKYRGSETPTASQQQPGKAIVLPPPISLKNAKVVLDLDEQHGEAMKKIILSILSFSIFVSAMFLHIPTTSMFQQHYGVFSTLATSGSDAITDQSPIKFYNIATIPNIFDWLNNTFTPHVFVTTDYNGAALRTDQWGRIATFSKVLGAVHFEVTYMETGDCGTPSSLLDMYTTCFHEARTTTEDFFIGFETNVSVATALLTDKKDSGSWLHSSTSQLLITVITLNAQVPGYAVTKLKLNFNDGGYIEPSASTTATLLDHYPSTTPIVLDALTVLWFSPWFLLSSIISNRKARRKQSVSPPTVSEGPSSERRVDELPDQTKESKGLTLLKQRFVDACKSRLSWSLAKYSGGFIVYSFYITVLVTQTIMVNSDFRRDLARIGEGGPIDGEASDNLKSVAGSFGLIASLTVLLRLLATAAVLTLALGILNAFRDHDGLSILTRTMKCAVQTFGPFSLIFALVFVAFAAAGTVLFGDRVHQFSSFMKAMKTCMNMLYGEFDFDSIKDIDYSVVYYWAYMTMETYVLLNIVLAIVIDAYTVEKNMSGKDKSWTFRRLVDNVFRQLKRMFYKSRVLLLSTCCRCVSYYSLRCVLLCRFRAPPRKEHVLWVRIQPDELQTKISDIDMARCDEELRWSTLQGWFPNATDAECKAIVEYLAREHAHQVKLDKTKKAAGRDGSNAPPANRDTVLSPKGIARDDNASPAQKHSDLAADIELLRLNMDQVITRTETLQQTLNVLVEQMRKSNAVAM